MSAADPLSRILVRKCPVSKWKKHILLARHDRLKQFLPKTCPYSPGALASYLTHYGNVVIKSELGGGGSQVCRVSKRSRGYQWQDYRQTAHARHLRDLQTTLPRWVVREQCVVQEYIDLLPMNGRPTDIRIIVQRNERGLFEMTGTFCKTAPPSRFVTNVKQGGAISSLSKYLHACCRDKSTRRQLRDQLRRVATDIGNHLGAQFRNSVYGIDFGLDHAHRIFIIEVNTKPSLEILAEISARMHQRAIALRRFQRTAETTIEIQESSSASSSHTEQEFSLHTFSSAGNPNDDGGNSVVEDEQNEQKLGIDPDNIHRANELPSALRVDKTKEVNFEAIRSQQAENFILNPGRQKR